MASLIQSSIPLSVPRAWKGRRWIPWSELSPWRAASQGRNRKHPYTLHSRKSSDSPFSFPQRGQLRCAFWTGSSGGNNNPEFWVRSAERKEDGTSDRSSISSSSDSWLSRLLKVDWPRLMFGISKDEIIWRVPWTLQTVLQVMFLWFLAFWLVGSWIIPFAAHMIGFSKDSLTYRGQALYSLITDVAEGTIGLGILHQCLLRFQPLSREWFPLSWHGKWYIEACLGCLMFPLVNRLSQINLDLLPFPSPLTSSNVEQSITARDPVATILYAIVVSVCAPIWEEVIFRGFLLPSLTRYLPVWASVVVSAFAFSVAHFSIQRLLPLTVLGLVMGIVFVRSRNLLASMLLHSLWNSFVFLDLLR
ncbi:hypothetical protein O6H91_17G028600 [Diphasiastrum complanatum]|uniref:Uncharacterized protein n=1 Tax=Diphasiastrum complanatum TaxID=34168 RepID=A0ACC2B574_DIPCM|nr:hypothetical protein O6H91_17G028600 [Diphasiastrum complanatum]